MAQMGKNLPATQVIQVQSLGWEDPLEKGMATHSSILAWIHTHTHTHTHNGLAISLACSHRISDVGIKLRPGHCSELFMTIRRRKNRRDVEEKKRKAYICVSRIASEIREFVIKNKDIRMFGIISSEVVWNRENG